MARPVLASVLKKGQHGLALQLGVNAFSFQDKSLYNGYLARTNLFMRPLPKLTVVLDASFRTNDYDSLTFLKRAFNITGY